MASGDITVVVAREEAVEATAGIKVTEAEAVTSEAEAGIIAAETVAWDDVVEGEREVGGHTVELVDTAAPGILANEVEEEVVVATAWAARWAAARCLLRSFSARPRKRWKGTVGGGVGRRGAPGWPRFAL